MQCSQCRCCMQPLHSGNLCIPLVTSAFLCNLWNRAATRCVVTGNLCILARTPRRKARPRTDHSAVAELLQKGIASGVLASVMLCIIGVHVLHGRVPGGLSSAELSEIPELLSAPLSSLSSAELSGFH